MKIQKSLDTKDIGSRVRKLRKARNMRQDELGIVLGDKTTGKPLSRGQISNLETGKRNFNLYQVKLLADFFGVSLDVLGVHTEEVETIDLLERARIIFENKSIPLEEKQALVDEILKLHISLKEQLKGKK